MTNPLVSVVILTYNHQAYLEACIASVMQQKTDFAFEVIIGEDASTDGSDAICKSWASRLPDQITYLRNPQNLGLPDNLIHTLARASGTYIAFLEGDDYWTNPLKLQTQMQHLLSAGECVASTHNTLVLNNLSQYPLLHNPKPIYTFEDTDKGRIFHTNSWLVSREVLPDFSLYHAHLICWDLLMEIKILEKGSVFCINDTYSVWRKHEGGNSVKIPLETQYGHFESLYLRLLQDAEIAGEKRLIRQGKRNLLGFYVIFSLEFARREKKLKMDAIRKALLWQWRTFGFRLGYLPDLMISYFSKAVSR